MCFREKLYYTNCRFDAYFFSWIHLSHHMVRCVNWFDFCSGNKNRWMAKKQRQHFTFRILFVHRRQFFAPYLTAKENSLSVSVPLQPRVSSHNTSGRSDSNRAVDWTFRNIVYLSVRHPTRFCSRLRYCMTDSVLLLFGLCQ